MDKRVCVCVLLSSSLEPHGPNHHMSEHVDCHDRQVGKKRTLSQTVSERAIETEI